MEYIENIVFFYGFNAKNLERCSDFLATKNHALFAEERSRYFQYDNHNFKQKLLQKVKNTSKLLPENICVFITADGFVNLRICSTKLPSDFDTDRYDFEESYETLNESISDLLFKQNGDYFLQDDFTSKIDFADRYLFHQHFITSNVHDVNVQWSLYTYKADTTKEQISHFLDIDTYIVEKNLLYMVYTKTFLHFMQENIKLEKARKLLITSRRRIAEHIFFYNEFSTKSVEIIREKHLFEEHNTPYMEKLYEKLDKDFESLTQNKENDRREKSAHALNRTILFLTGFNLVSIILAFLGVMITLHQKKILPLTFNLSSFTANFFEVLFYTLCTATAIMAIVAIWVVCVKYIKEYIDNLS